MMAGPGIRHVNEDNEVVFTTVKLLSVTTEGAWVTGLPNEIRSDHPWRWLRVHRPKGAPC